MQRRPVAAAMPGVLAHARGRCAATAPCQGHTTYVLGSLAAGGGLQSLRTCDLLCMQPASPSMPVRADKLACAAFAVYTDPAQGEKFFDTLDDVAMDGVILLDGMAIWGPPKSVGLTSLKLWLAGWLQQYDVNVAIMATVVTPNSNKVCRACQEAIMQEHHGMSRVCPGQMRLQQVCKHQLVHSPPFCKLPG